MTPTNTKLLISGDPLKAGCMGATSSRFILPFRWTREGKEAEDHTFSKCVCDVPHFAESDAEDWLHAPNHLDSEKRLPRLDADRRFYLSPETGEILFSQSCWFIMKNCPDDSWRWNIQTGSRGKLEAVMRPPALVLFGWKSADLKSGTGFLICDVHFEGEDGGELHYDQLLTFNESFRYWRCPYLGASKTKLHNQVNAESPRSWIEPEKGSVGRTPPANLDDEPFSFFDRWAELLKLPVFDEDHGTLRMVSDDAWNEARKWVGSPVEKERGWIIHSDNRMLVSTAVCCMDHGIDDPATKFGTFWTRLLNIDEFPENANTHEDNSIFAENWTVDRTYTRWQHLGTLYGFTTHSAAMLAPQGQPDRPPLFEIYFGMYFDMLLLIFFVRTRLCQFSEELSKISLKWPSPDMQMDLRIMREDLFIEEFIRFRREFDMFTNLYHFPLLSNQQQAIEMYSLMRKAYDVDAFHGEIEAEIRGTHESLALEASHDMGRTTMTLTVVATLGLLISIVVGFFGMNLLIPGSGDSGMKWEDFPTILEWTLVMIGVGIAILSLSAVFALALRFITRKGKLAYYSMYNPKSSIRNLLSIFTQP